MHNSIPKTIDYIEIPTRDLTATKEFFAALFGWQFENYGPEYAAFDDGRTTGGFFAADAAWNDVTACPLVVFYSAKLESTRADVERHGGRITREIFDFPGGRRFHFAAPGTGEFAVWSE